MQITLIKASKVNLISLSSSKKISPFIFKLISYKQDLPISFVAFNKSYFKNSKRMKPNLTTMGIC